VDTVLSLETEQAHEFRVLRSSKNRFGSVNELGLFEMTGKGFIEVKNPTAVFVQTEDEASVGSVISCIMEGTRPFLIELQALVTKTVFGYPQRKASGFDLNRLQVLSAVLSKRGGVNLANQDIILNVVGGLKIAEPALDLSACLAIVSSILNRPISRKTLVCGEVGLSGEVRNVRNLEARLKEAAKLGFTQAIVPSAFKGGVDGLEMVKVKRIGDLVEWLKLDK
jgi:DNA repair protein RadA/Sms